jgi:LCP family protein required for cell wall assembly
MRTTLKRGVGRAAAANGNGHAVYPPGVVSTIARYRQPPPPPRSRFQVVRRVLVVLVLAALSLGLAGAGGAYLWFEQEVDAVRAHSVDVKTAEKQLDVKLPGQAAIALVVGYDFRLGPESADVSRSDTIMLIRADPATDSISMLSFPRDLIVPVHCPGQPPVQDRINSAYARCGSRGTLETVKQLTGLPVNYLITVNFQGFRQIVDKVGGVWLDIDRRYFNRNEGTASTNYSNIDLQPGYQRLSGSKALSFVRFRHTDSDFHRLARQQAFVRAFKQQVSQDVGLRDLPGIVSVITDNVEVGAKSSFSGRDVLGYALFAARLPGGNFFQVSIDDVEGIAELYAPQSSIERAINQFESPDVTVSRVANAAATGRKLKSKTPAPKDTTVTVLNGNGVEGAAANANYLLSQRGYLMLLPPGDAEPNAPSQDYFHSQLYFDPRKEGSKEAAVALQKLLQPADVRPLPARPRLRALNPGSMVLVVVGQTFHNEITPAPVKITPVRQKASVRFDPTPARDLLQPLRRRVPFRLMVPTVLESGSSPDTLYGDVPVRVYKVTPEHKAVRLVFKTAGHEFWGVQQTDWPDAPVLSDRSFEQKLNDGRTYELHWSGPHLHMVVLRQGDRSYWVVNTLRDTLSNETMLAIAKGLKPLGPAQ